MTPTDEPNRLLIVEDDHELGRSLRRHFQSGTTYEVELVPSAEQALVRMGKRRFDLIILDLGLPGMSGLDFLRKTREPHAPPIVVLTGASDVRTVVSALRSGAADYVVKPVDVDFLDHVIQSALPRRQEQPSPNTGEPDPSKTAYSQKMRQTLDLARRFAESSATCGLLAGESGAGKEMVASYIHEHSARREGPFVRINLAAIPETMLEAQLFGSVRGAFTGASGDRRGIFSAAHGGTLLLDEIGSTRPEIQAKLLRAIENRCFYPVGSAKEVSADVRILGATNHDPVEALESGTLRPDLYYRLAAMLIHVPPLRERREDILPLTHQLMGMVTGRFSGSANLRFTEEAADILRSYDWPGNVRELRNTVQRVVAFADRDEIGSEDFHKLGLLHGKARTSGRTTSKSLSQASSPAWVRSEEQTEQGPPRPLHAVVAETVADVEREHIRATLQYTRGNRSEAAKLLGISRSTLWSKMRQYELV